MRKNRADPVHIIKECTEFQRYGFDVTLVTPRVSRKENVKNKSSIWGLFGIQKQFRIVELFTWYKDETASWIVRIQKFILFSLYFMGLLVFKNINKNCLIYSKCYVSVLPALFLKKTGLLKTPIAFEFATFTRKKWSHGIVAKSSDVLLFFNNYVKKKYIEEFKIDKNKIVQMGFFTQYNEYTNHIKNLGMTETRKRLGIHSGKKIVMYTGKISPEMKEIQYLLKAAEIAEEYEFVLVGAKEEFKVYFDDYVKKQNLQNVTFKGFQPLKNIYEYIFCSDLLVSYYDSYDSLSVNQRSPAKSGIYICSGKPIIFADLPSLREIFTDDMVFFVPPDEPELLVDKIREIFSNPEITKGKNINAIRFAIENTYENSFRKISDKILKKIN